MIVAGGGLRPEPVPGYAARILDGNVLTGTEHRIVPLRTTWSAGLPGMSLAVYEPASGLILDMVLEENAHAQERALLDRSTVEPGQLWIMDRNFCVRTLLFRIERGRGVLPGPLARVDAAVRATGRCGRRAAARPGGSSSRPIRSRIE